MDEEADVDCAERLQEAKREIKVLNYQLSQLVSGINDKSNTLHPRYPLDIEIMEETLMSYKIVTKGQYCPMKVQIDYNDKKQKGGGKGDLKIFCSAIHREPSEHEC